MQERVTYQNFKIVCKLRKDKGFKALFFLLSMIVGCLFFCVAVFEFVPQKKKYNVFKEQSVFFLSLAKTSNKNNVEFLKDKVRKVGGAGYVFVCDGVYKVIGFAYENKNVAEEIAKNIVGEFDVEIIERKIPKTKRKVKQQICCSPVIFESYKFIFNEIAGFYENIILYSKFKISDAEMYNIIAKNMIEIKALQDQIEGLNLSKKMHKLISKEILTMLFTLENSLKIVSTEIYKSGQISVEMKKEYIFLVEMQIKMVESLNKIR